MAAAANAEGWSRRALLLALLVAVPFVVAARVPAARAAVPTVPLAPFAPTLDGNCGEGAYAAGPTVVIGAARARLVHSGYDLYVCVAGLRAADGDVSLRVDPTGAAGVLGIGNATFSLARDGSRQAMLRGATGTAAPADFAGVRRASSAELRVGLSWLGGYGRTVRLSLAVAGGGGSWPASARPTLPSSWGRVALGPIYPPRVQAGAAFVDGDHGYLVVPWSAALNPRELTVEAWIRRDGGCGPVVGNGALTAYAVAACDVLELVRAGATERGDRPLGPGWHHVAVTIDADGTRSLYVDGVLDASPGAQHVEAGEEREPEESGGQGTAPLRIGSDADGAPGLPGFRGYVRDLRIWKRVLSPSEIRDWAQREPTGHEPDLVGWWPFATSLADRSGGRHDAGIVGVASLARTPAGTRALEPVSRPSGARYRSAPPLRAWDGVLPSTQRQFTVDGVCGGNEYAGAARVLLEPSRALGVTALVAPDGLHVCTGPLFASDPPARSDMLTLLVGPAEGEGAKVVDADNVRVSLRPDGQVTASTGDGQRFTGPPPQGLRSASRSGSRIDLQDDLNPIEAHWYSVEFVVPLSPDLFGQPLRLAVGYSGTATLPRPLFLSGRWPRVFSENDPSSWGLVRTQPATLEPEPPVSVSRRRPQSSRIQSGSQDALQAHGPAALSSPLPAGWPRSQPTVGDYGTHCKYPSSGAGGLPYAFVGTTKWPEVQEGLGPQRAEGTLSSIEISSDDSPYIHGSHDLDMVVTVADRFGWLVMDQNGPDGKPGPMTSRRLVVETESSQLPDYARPAVGDRVAFVGRWIIDCGHTDPAKTEIHPTPIFESDRVEWRSLVPGGPPRLVRVAKVWFNSRPSSTFGYTFGGPFSFDLPLPNAGALPFVQVVEQSPELKIASSASDGVAHLTVTPASSGLGYAEVIAGTLDGGPLTAYALQPYTVTLDQIDIVHDHDSGLAGEDGEWYLDVTANGKTLTYFRDSSVCDEKHCGLYPPPGGPVSFPVFMSPDERLQIQVSGYEEDSTTAESARSIAGGDTDEKLTGRDTPWNLGPISARLGPQRLCASSGYAAGGPLDPHCDGFEGSDWVLYYHVSKGGSPAAVTHEPPFWGPRLADELADGSARALAVPTAEGASATTATGTAYITERALDRSGLRVLGTDTDERIFTFPEFADLTVATNSGALIARLKSPDSWAWLPPTLETASGEMDTTKTLGYYRRATLEVASKTSSAGDLVAGWTLQARYHKLPPDWGEHADLPVAARGSGGRIVDLRTTTAVTKPWAWQHVVGDIDRYRILLPKIVQPPAGHVPCEFDEHGTLTIALGTGGSDFPDLTVTTDPPLTEGADVLELDDLASRLPDGGQVKLSLDSASPGVRALYQFSAGFEPAKWLDKKQCETARKLRAYLTRRYRQVLTIQQLIRWFIDRHGRPPGTDGPGDPGVPLTSLGAFLPVALGPNGNLNQVIATPAGSPANVRVYDPDGVLLAEGTPLTNAQAAKQPTISGLIPISQVAVHDPGLRYALVQVDPTNAGPSSNGRLRVGVEPLH